MKKKHHKQSKKTSYGLEENTCNVPNSQKISKQNLQQCPQSRKSQITQQKKRSEG